MIEKIDHISFAVKSLEETGKRMREVYGAQFLMHVENEEWHYTCDAYVIGNDIIVGLLQSTSPEGFITHHIEKFGESLQHIGVDVADLDASIEKLKEYGIRYSNYKEMAGVKKEVLIGAHNAFGAVLQLQEWMGEYKDYSPGVRMLKAWGQKEN